MSLFQYQGLAEPILPPAGPDAWEYPPQVPVRRALAAAVALFVCAPVLVPPDASQFQYPAQNPVRAAARPQPDGTVCPLSVFSPALLPRYPAQVPVRKPARQQPQSTVLPPLITSGPVTDTIYIDLTPDGGCPGDANALCVGLAVGPLLDQSLCVFLAPAAAFAAGPLLDKSLHVGQHA